ncbi:MAG TPA: TolC family protein [Parvularculaceae bacterium]|nr:TolC family protein [Caulobacterales bacterium]HOP19924.1 TolC family protein [Amphiplicatus sp.]HPE32907.1 TolC family protein [Parvularculaceae bacterium]HRX38936.1 TolC family protein [Parvularculaceae bacterium]
MLRRGAAAVSLLVLASCASVNEELLDAQLPEPPAAWSADSNAGAAPTGDWIGAFGDDTLYALIDEALRHNNNLLAAAANLDAARASARVTRANMLPTLGAQAQAGRNAIVTDPSIAAQTGGNTSTSGLRAQELEDQYGIDTNGDGKLDGLDLDGNGSLDAPIPNRRVYINSFALGAQLSWELDLWGRLSDETRAAYKQAGASLADFEAARLSLAGAVAQGWFSLIEARQQRELAERDTTAREDNLRVTERRFERGVASSLDVRLARSAHGSSKANLAFRQQAEKEAARRIEVLLGRYPSAELDAAAALPSLPDLQGAGAPGDILARRPDLIAAEARMEAAGLQARAARKQMLPRLTLTSQISTSGPDLSDVIDPERLAGNIFAGLAQPLFQGGRILANSKRARAAAESALLSYAQTALEAYEEAENALAAEYYLALREEALKLAYEEAASAEELTDRRYASGAATIFNLLDAQTRRISAESAYIQAQQQRVSNRVRLYLAIGGEFVTGEEVRTASAADVSGTIVPADSVTGE